MSGKTARDGFWFQDAMALLRLLEDAVLRSSRRALGEDPGPELEVRVEAPVVLPGVTLQGQPHWDTTYTVGTTVTVDESKKGGPSAEDRRVFYLRLRRSALSCARVEDLRPRFTVERDAVENDEKWHGLADAARTVAIARPDGAVRTADALAAEALYYLTDADAYAPERVMSLPENSARDLLGRFTLDNSRPLRRLNGILQPCS